MFLVLFTIWPRFKGVFTISVLFPDGREIFFKNTCAFEKTISGLPVKIFETHYHKTKKFFVLCDFGSGFVVVARNATVFWIDDFLKTH